jgi:hypothetical protein
LAVLIDADNAQAAVMEGLLADIARFGEVTVRRIYGDFTSQTSSSWKKVLQQHAIKPVQQFAYTTGKNATDSMLIIDAMDLLYTRRFEGFCLVTSDSDFTGLAMRLREEGLTVRVLAKRRHRRRSATPATSLCSQKSFVQAWQPNRRGRRSVRTPSLVDSTREKCVAILSREVASLFHGLPSRRRHSRIPAGTGG